MTTEINPLKIFSMRDMETEYAETQKAGNALALDLGDWLPWLNLHLRKIVPGEVVFIMGDTGVGKTGVLQNIAACANYLNVLMFELELPKLLMFERFAAAANKIPQCEVEQAYQAGRSLNVLNLHHIWTCADSCVTSDQLHETIRTASTQMDGNFPHLVMVDYVGLMTVKGARGRYEQMTQLAIDLKRIAKDTNTIIIGATQVSRDEEREEIGLHDAKDSGQIENSAGTVIGIWRDVDHDNSMWVKILKSTKGGAGHKRVFEFNGAAMTIGPTSPQWYLADKDAI